MKISLLRVSVAGILACFAAHLAPARAAGFADAAILAPSGPVAIGGMLRGSPVWDAWRRRFVSDAGRVIDTGNGAFSHSEGQGYGLLLAAAAADRAAFDQILTWTTLNLNTRKDNLAAWRWTGQPRYKQDPHNASDGDILIAWALAEAADYWSDSGYLSAAQAMTKEIAAKLVKPTRAFGPVLMPAAEGFGPKERPDGPVVNLSYWVFPAFYRLAQLHPAFDWNAVMQSGLDLIARAQFGKAKLPTDWLSLAKPNLSPAQGFDERFGYDALRIPLYLFWADAATSERLSVFDSAWRTGAAIVATQGAGEALAEPGYQAVAALLRCSCQGTGYPQSFYRFSDRQNYYPATLHLLSLIAATMRGGACLDRREMDQILAQNWQPRIGSLERLESGLEPAAYVQTPPEADAAPPPAPKAGAQLSTRRAVVTEVRDMPQDADIFSYLRVIAGVLTVLGGLYYLLNRSDQEPEEERTEAQNPAPWKPAPGQYDLVPRTLPQNPFKSSSRIDILAREIEAAAEASVRLSRTVGLIYFEFPALVAFEAENGAEGSDQLIASLAQDFRRALRETDHVAIINGRQILVSICLLAGRKDLETVASRLTAAARRRDLIDEGAPSLPAGIAIYPLDGYGGLDLIESARRHYRELRPEVPAPETHAEASVTTPPHQPHQTRKRSRRRPSRKTRTPQPAA
ncbi:glycosyl hydrolase family 8 [Methylocystis sp. JAN1]|uniref:glycosyl hydrolase family 8 n=1 Tax=Methylocystis sp. JAN1 TaxID=3397211 RepID=UPI003FA28341